MFNPILGSQIWRTLATACVLIFSAQAEASETDCQLQATPGETSEALITRAQRIEPDCSKDVDFLFNFGLLLSSNGLYDLAIDRLEGVLMRAPGHWPARIEYAIALEGAGDRSSADALLAELEADPTLPESLRAELQVRRRQWQLHSTGGKWHFRHSLALLLGHDNNLLGAPRTTSLSLTLPNGTLPVTLDPSSGPRSGMFTRLDWREDARYVNVDGSYWNAALAANFRFAPNQSETNFSLAGLALERIAAGQQGIYGQVAIQNLNTTSGDIYRLIGIGSGWDLNHQTYACRSRLGLEAQYRLFPHTEILNGQYLGVLIQALCPRTGWVIRLRAGAEHAEYDKRPGGDQTRLAIHVGKTTTWGNHQVTTDFSHEQQQDNEGFSPLLENNLRRKINKSIYRIEYTHLDKKIEPIAGMEWLEQKSNLPLYRTSTFMAYIGLRWLW